MTLLNGNATTRGAVEITLGDHTFRMTPSWQALDEIETGLGVGIGFLFGKAMHSSTALSFNEMAVIITAGIRATGVAERSDDRNVALAKVKELLFNEGPYNRAVEVVAFIAAAINGGRLVETGPGKVEAEAETADSPSADTSV